jgi:D-alanyl-D-alanine carboxypeptidase (penicillin-binding protein 5/6)
MGDMRLISVVLGAKTDRIRFNESEKLLTWGFRFFETVTPIKPDATFVNQRVWFGAQSEAKLGAGSRFGHHPERAAEKPESQLIP